MNRRSFMTGLMAAGGAMILPVRRLLARESKVILGQKFASENIDITGKTFIGCAFIDCTLNGDDYTIYDCMLLRCGGTWNSAPRSAVVKSYIECTNGGVAIHCNPGPELRGVHVSDGVRGEGKLSLNSYYGFEGN